MMNSIRLPFLAALTFAAVFPLVACDSGDAAGEPPPEPQPVEAEAETPEPEPEPAKPEPEPTEAAAAETGGAETGDSEPEAAETGDSANAAAAEGDAEPEDTKPEEPKPDAKKDGGKSKPSGPKIDAQALYMAKCKKCHGANGDSDTKMGKKYEIEPLKGAKISKKKAAKAIRKGVPDTKMKPFESKLTGDEIDALAAFVTKL